MNMPSLFEFVRDPASAWARQFREYAANARECLAAARQSYGVAKRVHLRSARHYGKLARLTLSASQEVAA